MGRDDGGTNKVPTWVLRELLTTVSFRGPENNHCPVLTSPPVSAVGRFLPGSSFHNFLGTETHRVGRLKRRECLKDVRTFG